MITLVGETLFMRNGALNKLKLPSHTQYHIRTNYKEVTLINLKRSHCIDEYSMKSHCQATQKLEYNGGFRVQLQVITFMASMKETLFYK